MGFDQLAKNLLDLIPQEKTPLVKEGKEDLKTALANAGFSKEEILSEYRTLLDNAEESTVKKGILDSVAKMQGMLTPDDNKRDIPNIIINVQGDNAKLAMMLNPSLAT